ncbi:DUF2264 domain-containing protein [Actinomyces vulturis]|uniref:DUF2264 domain-containing protein n=1 Tax=Actinomyces vulturis TaxID=1857645 RepID=UPI00083611BC|nr:DUF2264 domain-containing protein [Actinomyces vulturis]
MTSSPLMPSAPFAPQAGASHVTGALITGLSRNDWIDRADMMLGSLQHYATPGHAGFDIPGLTSMSGYESDKLEGFARSFLLAGFRLAGSQGQPVWLADFYREGLIAGTTPDSPESWPRLSECPQAKVEAASICLILDMTRPWIWDMLSGREQANVIRWLEDFVGDDSSPRNNWLWFRVVVETFLRSVGGPWSEQDIITDLRRHDSYYQTHGWLSDGAARSYDYYAGWAMHLYPTLWARMDGARDFASPRRERDHERLERFITDYVQLIATNGAPIFQGRSLIYRFAAAAPFWAAALDECTSVPMGQLRTAASAMLNSFTNHGTFGDPEAGSLVHGVASNPEEVTRLKPGILSPGWLASAEIMRQEYSGPASPYWASKGMLGIALPDTHPIWQATEEPLPHWQKPTMRTVKAPGWITTQSETRGTQRAAIIINHGTDHSAPGHYCVDAPLYATYAYSSATTPIINAERVAGPLDQHVGLIAPVPIAPPALNEHAGERTLAANFTGHDGQWISNRTGFITRALGADEHTHWAVSEGQTTWIWPYAEQNNFGGGLEGQPVPAGHLTVISLVRGGWEARCIKVTNPTVPDARLRLSGWALSAHAGAPTTTLCQDGADSCLMDTNAAQADQVQGHHWQGAAMGASTPQYFTSQTSPAIQLNTPWCVRTEAINAYGMPVTAYLTSTFPVDLSLVSHTGQFPMGTTMTYPQVSLALTEDWVTIGLGLETADEGDDFTHTACANPRLNATVTEGENTWEIQVSWPDGITTTSSISANIS